MFHQKAGLIMKSKVLSIVALVAVFVVSSGMAKMMNNSDDSLVVAGPKFNQEGQLIKDDGWREWVFIGTPLTPNSLNDGKAAFPEFHNVYIEPSAYRHFVDSGEFPNGTMIAKELVSVGETAAVSGNGFFQGDFQGLEFAVKDTERYADQPGGWSYFSFGHALPYQDAATAFPTEACAACHQAAADFDMVFTQYYPVLRAAMKK